MTKTKHNLLGNRMLIGKYETYNNLINKKTTIIPRNCDLCFYREKNNCNMENCSAHIYFEIDIEDALPEKIENIEIGNYCPYFIYSSH